MRIKVKIDDIEVEVDRPKFHDYDYHYSTEKLTLKKDIMNDSILPILNEAVEKAKELYNLRNNG